MVYTIAKFILKVIASFYNRIKVYGKHHIPKDGPLIIVANHKSYLDPIYIGISIPRKLHFMAKKESFQKPFPRWLLTNLGAFPVNRDKSDITAIKKAIQYLKEGKILALFPEGTRREDEELTDLKQGAAYFAAKTKAPILPIYVRGTDKVMPKRSSYIKPKKVEVFIGQPINVSDFGKDDKQVVIEKLTDSIRYSIEKLKIVSSGE